MGVAVCIGNIAGDLGLSNTLCGKGETRRRIITVLHFQARIINGAAVKPRAGSGFQTSKTKS
jgi:hypothetical protein